jgi:hypothetical protein
MTVSQLLVNFVITQRRCRTSKYLQSVEGAHTPRFTGGGGVGTLPHD